MSLQSAVTFLRGVKDTADVIEQEKPLEISSKIWMHDPNKNRGLTWFMSEAGAPKSKGNHVFGHLEDVPFGNFVEYVGADESSQVATGLIFKAGAGKKLALGSRVFFPAINEIIRLTADMASDTVTAAVARNFGRGNATTSLLKTGMKGLILRPSMIQGFTMGSGLSNSMVYKSFSMTETSYPVEVTNVEYNETHRGGNPFQRALKKSLKQAKDQLEAELYFGGKVEDSSTYAHPISASEGLENYITTNVYSTSKLSRLDLWDIIAEWSFQNPSLGAIHCSGLFKAMITNWGVPFVQLTQEETTLGLNIDRIRTPFGVVELVPIDLFNQDATLAGRVFFVPSGHTEYAYLQGMDIGYKPVEPGKVHSKFGEIYGMSGLEFFEEEMFMKLSGLQFAA